MEKMFNEGNQIHNFIFSSGSGTVINYGSGSDSTCQKVTVPTVPVPVESWQRAVTLDDSQTPTLVLHNTSVVV